MMSDPTAAAFDPHDPSVDAPKGRKAFIPLEYARSSLPASQTDRP